PTPGRPPPTSWSMGGCAAAACAKAIASSASSPKARAFRAPSSRCARWRMRERDVPQEGNATLDGHRKAVYAVGEDGKLRIVTSRGWGVGEVVTRQAIEDLERRARAARRRALAGRASAPGSP